VQEGDLTEEKRGLASSDAGVATTEKPLILFLTGAPGAGKTTFYESKLRESFPILLRWSSSPLEQAEVEHQRRELLKTRKSFVFQSSVVDVDLVEKARSHGFDIKVIFIGTEHPDLNIARILSRVSRGGLFGPIATLHEEYESGLLQLKSAARAADELILLDNTEGGWGPRVIAQLVNGGFVKLAHSMPKWAQRVFAKEFDTWLARERAISHERVR
jgi:predicted ABC-type ATPase